jgi:hypothetical protein
MFKNHYHLCKPLAEAREKPLDCPGRKTREEVLMATKRGMPWEPKRFWPAGEYTLLVASYKAEDGMMYSKGDTLPLSQWEATKLGNEGAVAPPSSMHAVRARVQSDRGTVRDEYLYQMWTLTGAWQDRGT